MHNSNGGRPPQSYPQNPATVGIPARYPRYQGPQQMMLSPFQIPNNARMQPHLIYSLPPRIHHDISQMPPNFAINRAPPTASIMLNPQTAAQQQINPNIVWRYPQNQAITQYPTPVQQYVHQQLPGQYRYPGPPVISSSPQDPRNQPSTSRVSIEDGLGAQNINLQDHLTFKRQQKKRSHAMSIVNPETGKAVSLDELSGASSHEISQPALIEKHIAAEFATKVAAVALDKKDTSEHSNPVALDKKDTSEHSNPVALDKKDASEHSNPVALDKKDASEHSNPVDKDLGSSEQENIGEINQKTASKDTFKVNNNNSEIGNSFKSSQNTKKNYQGTHTKQQSKFSKVEKQSMIHATAPPSTITPIDQEKIISLTGKNPHNVQNVPATLVPLMVTKKTKATAPSEIKSSSKTKKPEISLLKPISETSAEPLAQEFKGMQHLSPTPIVKSQILTAHSTSNTLSVPECREMGDKSLEAKQVMVNPCKKHPIPDTLVYTNEKFYENYANSSKLKENTQIPMSQGNSEKNTIILHQSIDSESDPVEKHLDIKLQFPDVPNLSLTVVSKSSEHQTKDSFCKKSSSNGESPKFNTNGKSLNINTIKLPNSSGDGHVLKPSKKQTIDLDTAIPNNKCVKSEVVANFKSLSFVKSEKHPAKSHLSQVKLSSTSVCKEGRKTYSRDYLLEFRDNPLSLKCPENILCIQLLKKNVGTTRIPINESCLGKNIHMPNFLRHNATHQSTTFGKNQQETPSTPKIIHLSLNEEVKLNESSNAWRPKVMQRATENISLDDQNEALFKRVRSILNKLTPQKFELLVDQVKALQIDSEEKLSGVIDLVFLKAVDEPNFSVAYAMLCQTLSMLQVPKREKSTESVNFRLLLLDRCQLEFNKPIFKKEEHKPKKKANEIDEPQQDLEIDLEEEEEERRMRKKNVGINRFIGELFKRKMIASKIMNRCIIQLLETGDEESLECMCQLLSTIGEQLENKKETTKMHRLKNPFDLSEHFQRIQEIVNQGVVSKRIRFMLQDVIDLRAGNWKPRRNSTNPQTLAEVVKDTEEETFHQPAVKTPRTTRGRDCRMQNKNSKREQSETNDGWNVVGSSNRPASRAPLEINKLKVKSDIKALNLGCQNQFTLWSKGSGGLQCRANPFDVLSKVEKNNNKAAQEKAKVDSTSSIERASLLVEVKKFTSCDSRPSSKSSTPVMQEAIVSCQKNPSLTGSMRPDKNLETRAKLILDEYFIAENHEDLINCIKEELDVSQLSKTLYHWLTFCLEWSTSKRSKTAHIIALLHQKNTIDLSNILNALEMVLENTDDLIIDIPMAHLYLAELLTPVIIAEIVSFSNLKHCFKSTSGSKGVVKLMLPLIKLLLQEVNSQWILSHWMSSDMSWSEFMPVSEVDAFLANHGLEFFLCEPDLEVSVSFAKHECSADNFRDNLLNMLQKSSLKKINEWIICNHSYCIKESLYMRVLVAAVCENAIFENQLKKERFKHNCQLIQRWVDGDSNLELQTLFSIQTVIDSLMHPPNLLLNILETLLDNSIISKDAILAWAKSEDPAEIKGREIALMSISHFVSCLTQPEETESADEY